MLRYEQDFVVTFLSCGLYTLCRVMKVDERKRSRPSARDQSDIERTQFKLPSARRAHAAAGRLFPPFLESISYGG